MEPFPPMPVRSPDVSPGFHLLAKPSGSTCNIDCTYCFFLSKEALYPNDKSRMSMSTLEVYIRQLLESHRTPDVTIAWQGGEPTLMKLEKGDPTVSAGVYATALWMIQRHDALAVLADPRLDLAALESEVRTASRRGAKINA